MCNYKGKRKKIPIGCVQSFSSLLFSKKYFYNRKTCSNLAPSVSALRLQPHVHRYFSKCRFFYAWHHIIVLVKLISTFAQWWTVSNFTLCSVYTYTYIQRARVREMVHHIQNSYPPSHPPPECKFLKCSYSLMNICCTATHFKSNLCILINSPARSYNVGSNCMFHFRFLFHLDFSLLGWEALALHEMSATKHSN